MYGGNSCEEAQIYTTSQGIFCLLRRTVRVGPFEILNLKFYFYANMQHLYYQNVRILCAMSHVSIIFLLFLTELVLEILLITFNLN